MWTNTGGGSFVGTDVELASDTSYEADDGRTIEFVSSSDLRYGGFFPEEMTEEEMLSFIETCSDRKDVETSGIQEPSSSWIFEDNLDKNGVLEKIEVSNEPTEVTNLDGTKRIVFLSRDEEAYNLYQILSGYLIDTDGCGDEIVDREVLTRLMKYYVDRPR
jgi:hypothetical protein